MKRQLLFLTLSAVIFASSTNAQWGMRYILPQTETITQAGIFDLWLLGVGLDHDVSERTSWGVDLLFDTNWSHLGKDRTGGGNSVISVSHYNDKVKVFGVQYRSQYHFGDVDGTSLYIGPTIGVRTVRQIFDYELAYFDPYYGYSSFVPVEQEISNVVFPVGFRLGLRGGLEGGYGNVYIGAGYAIGSGSAPKLPTYLSKESELSKVNFQIGVAFGLGG